MLKDMWSKLNIAQAIAVTAIVGGFSYVVAENFELVCTLLSKVSAGTYIAIASAIFGTGASVGLGKLFHAEPVRGASMRPKPMFPDPAPLDNEETKP